MRETQQDSARRAGTSPQVRRRTPQGWQPRDVRSGHDQGARVHAEARGKQKKARYIPALDGLRALAVIAVIFYHLGAGWAQGGLLGVTLFFVLSGYLITGILVDEIERTGKLDLKNFWLRRVRRLFPAIVVVIVVVALLCALFNHPLLTKMRPDIPASLFWFQNWWYVFRDLSYFENLGDPSPLTHFWSLAIEEQFYLVWPLVLLLLYRVFGRRRKAIGLVCLALAIVSAAWMAFLFNPGADPTRVYYGTDTRAFSLLAGALLAFVWPSRRAEFVGKVNRGSVLLKGIDVIGTIALAAIIVMMVLVDGTSAFMYRGGLVLASLLTVILMVALVMPDGLLARFFSSAALVWVGKRSYGMYLWHYPLILLLSPLDPAASGHSWWIYLLVFALTFAVSGLSYRFVEDPIRHGAIGRALTAVRERGFGSCVNTWLRRPSLLVSTGACVVVLVAAAVGCIITPNATTVPEGAINSTGSAVDAAIPADAVSGSNAATSGKAEQKAQGASAGEQKKVKMHNPLLIGDSVPGDSNNEFKSKFPNGLNDSYVGRATSQGIKVYKEYAEEGRVGDVVVFACFSNHKIADGQLEDLYKAVGEEHELFVVNVKVPETFESYNNKQLAAFDSKYANVHLIDWYSTVKDHMSEYLWNDKTHLKPTGARAYQDLIYENIKGYLPRSDYKTTPAKSSKYGQ